MPVTYTQNERSMLYEYLMSLTPSTLSLCLTTHLPNSPSLPCSASKTNKEHFNSHQQSHMYIFYILLKSKTKNINSSQLSALCFFVGIIILSLSMHIISYQGTKVSNSGQTDLSKKFIDGRLSKIDNIFYIKKFPECTYMCS